MSARGELEKAQLREAIAQYAAGGYRVDRVIDAVCPCGSETFELVFDDEVGVAARICVECEEELGLADSEEHFDDTEGVQQAECTCGNGTFRVATGFALDDDGEVRWVSVGLRCTRDAVAGVYVDWKIDYLPTGHLFANA